MRIAILGTGMVGRSLSSKLAALGHDVAMGTRDVEKTLLRTEPGPMGGEPFSAWYLGHRGVKLASFSEAAKHGELIINATHGTASIEALRMAGEGNLGGKIILDVANLLEYSDGAAKVLASAEESLAENIHRTFPDAKVVKSLCTVNAMLMVDPAQLSKGEHSVFLSGNDPDAKRRVSELLREGFGWKDVIDLGDISTARGQEMLMGLWLRLWGALKSPMFNYKIVRG